MIVEQDINYESNFIFDSIHKIIPIWVCNIISDYTCSTKRLIIYSYNYTDTTATYFWKGDYTKGQYHNGLYKVTLTPKGGYIPRSLCGDIQFNSSVVGRERKFRMEFEIHRQDLKMMLQGKEYDSDTYKHVTINSIEHLAYSILCNVFNDSSHTNYKKIITKITTSERGILTNLEEAIYGENIVVFIYCLEYVHYELKLVSEILKTFLAKNE